MPGPALPSNRSRPMNPLEWAILLILSVIWGGAFFFNAVAVAEIPVFTVVVSRVAIAALVLFILLRLTGRAMPTDRVAWAAFFGMGLLNNAIPFTLIVWGQQHIASGVASILNAAAPLFTVFLAHLLTDDEKLSGGRLAGVVLGFGGVAVMIGMDGAQALGTHVAAQLACLAAALSYGLAGIFGRRFHAMGIAPMATATGQVMASGILLVPMTLFVDRPWTLPAPSLGAIGALLGLALLSTAFAYILFFRILATVGATNVILVTFLIPVSAILLGIAFLGETLHTQHLAGMALIGAGLAAIDGRPWRALRQRLDRSRHLASRASGRPEDRP